MVHSIPKEGPSSPTFVESPQEHLRERDLTELMFLQNALCFGTREAVGNLIVVGPNIARVQPEPSDSFQSCEQLQQEPRRRGPACLFSSQEITFWLSPA